MADLQDQITALRARWEAEPNSRVFVQLAEAYRRSGHPKQALEVLRQGLSRVPDYLSGQVALGRCYLDLEKPVAAVEILERVLKRDPTHLVANKLLIRAHLDGKNVKAAKERLDHYRLLNDGDPVIAELQQSIREVERRLAGHPEPSAEDPTTRLEALVAESGVLSVPSLDDEPPAREAAPPPPPPPVEPPAAEPTPVETPAPAAPAIGPSDTVMLTPAMLAEARKAGAAREALPGPDPEVEAEPLTTLMLEPPAAPPPQLAPDVLAPNVEVPTAQAPHAEAPIEHTELAETPAQVAPPDEATGTARVEEVEVMAEPEGPDANAVSEEGDLFAVDEAALEESTQEGADATAVDDADPLALGSQPTASGEDEDLFPDLGDAEALVAAADDEEEDLFGDLFGDGEDDQDVFAQELESEGLFMDLDAEAGPGLDVETPSMAAEEDALFAQEPDEEPELAAADSFASLDDADASEVQDATVDEITAASDVAPATEVEAEPELAAEPAFVEEAAPIEEPALAVEPELEVEFEAVSEAEDIAAEPVAAEPVAAEPVAAEEPLVEPEPVVEAEAIFEPEPVIEAAAAHPMAQGFDELPSVDAEIEVESADISRAEDASQAQDARQAEEASQADEESHADEESDDDPAPPATATLGQLYLQQGHLAEARRIFSEVLTRDPMNPVALAGLSALDRARDRPLRAADLLREADPNADLTARKIVMLGNYLQRLRQASAEPAGSGHAGQRAD